MKLYEKLLVAILTVTLMLGLFSIAFANSLSDLKGHWAEDEIQSWVSQGFILGYPDGTFKPDNQISRAEFISLVNRSFKLQDANTECEFADIKNTDWFYKDVAIAKAAGYIAGYEDNTFRPGRVISRQEAAVAVTRLLKLKPTNDLTVLDKFSDAKDVPAWSKVSLSTVVTAGIFNGYPDQTIKPFKAISRAEAIHLLSAALKTIAPIPPAGSGGGSSGGGGGGGGGGGTPGDVTSATIAGFSTDGNSIRLGDGRSYSISTVLKNTLLNKTMNEDILKNAAISFSYSNSSITKVTYLKLTSGGNPPVNREFDGNKIFNGGNGTIDGAVEIVGDYITLKNVTITGNLTITQDVENDFKIDNVTVQGTTIVNGCSPDTFGSSNSRLKKAEFNHPNTGFYSEGDTQIDELVANVDTTIDGPGTIERLSVEGRGAKVTVNSPVTNAAVRQPDVTLSGTGTITGNLSVESAGKTNINMNRVANVAVDAEGAQLSGTGHVDDLTVSASGPVVVDLSKVNKVKVTANNVDLQGSTEPNEVSMEQGSSTLALNLPKVKKVSITADNASLQGSTQPDEVSLGQGAGTVELNLPKVKKISISTNNVSLQGSTQSDEVSLDEGAGAVALNLTSVSVVTVSESAQNVQLSGNTQISELSVEADRITISGAVKVEKVVIRNENTEIINETGNEIKIVRAPKLVLNQKDRVVDSQNFTVSGNFKALNDKGSIVNLTVKLNEVTQHEVNSPTSDKFSFDLVLQPGNNTVIVTVTDNDGESTTKVLNIYLNSGPTVVNAIDDITLSVGESKLIQLLTVFVDVDNDVLSYKVTVVSGRENVNASIKQGILVITAKAEGLAVVKVTAIDGKLECEDEFSITVTEDAKQKAIGLAEEAIAALPSVEVLTLDDKTLVDAARAKVEAAKALGAVDADITNLSKLTAAEAKIAELEKDLDKETAIKAAIDAITALPAVNALTLNDKAAVAAARAKVETAKAKGAIDADITNLSKLTAAEAKIAELENTVEPPPAELELGTPVPVVKDVPMTFKGGIKLDFSSLSIPAGLSVTVEEVNNPSLPTGSGLNIAGKVLNITFDGTIDFSEGVGVELSIPVNGGINDAGIFYKKDNSSWEYQKTTIVNGVAVATVNHFSTYGVLEADQVEAPTASPLGGSVEKDTAITLETATAGAAIYFTVDGSEPTTASSKYSDANKPIVPDGGFTIKAIAVADNMRDSETQTFIFTTDGTLPTISEIYSISGAVIGDSNTITVPISGITKTSGIGVSRACKLSFSVEGLGPFGDFDLKTGINNNIFNIPIPDIANSNISAIDVTVLFNALKLCDSNTKKMIIRAIDFNTLFNLVKSTDSDTKADIIDSINFTNLFEAIKDSSSDTKDALFSDMNTIMRLALEDDAKLGVLLVIYPAFEVAYDKGLISPEEKEELKKAILNNDIASINFSAFFNKIKAADTDTKNAIYNAIDFAVLFNAINNLEASTKSAIFDAINFNNIFNAVRSFDQPTKDIIYADFINVVSVIEESNISRSDIVNTIKFSDLDRTSIFNWLKNIDGDSDELIIVATLKDGDGKANSYTVIIEE